MKWMAPVVIDARGHLLGRLASRVAKQLLKGQRITVVRCEDLNISGSLWMNRMKFQRFLRLRMNTNPKKGPHHYRAPSMIFWRCVRGMLPYKKFRGRTALGHLKMFEGVPPEHERTKRVIVPTALRILNLRFGRKYTRLGDLSSRVGWKHDELIKRLEDKRKVRSAAYYQKKRELQKMHKEAVAYANEQLSPENKEVIEKYTAPLSYM